MNQFIITSHGWSGSNWLSHVLNAHPTITCTHSARNILANDINMQSNKELKQNIHQLHKGYVSRQNVSLDDIYLQIEKMSKTLFYGSVHVLRQRDIPVIFEKFGKPKREFNVINLVRNPIDLVWSGYGQFKDLFKYDINELFWTLKKIIDNSKEFVHDIGNKYNINIGETENLAFIGAASVLLSLKKDADAETKIRSLPNIKYLSPVQMEQLTTDKKYFKDFLSKITNNKIIIEDSYIENVFKTGKINKHKKDNKKLTPKERYCQFNDWQKEIFKYYLSKFELKEYFENMDYSLSFL